jgi:16S rRNA (adenine1518-N6/adenine1519-N6)-dimethyltransferase
MKHHEPLAAHSADSAYPPSPRRSLGQNFLVNPNVIRAIADAAAPDETTLTVELGVGRGALSRELCQRTTRVTGIEKDLKLLEWAAENSIYPSNLDIIAADMLDVDFAALAADHGKKLNVIGNLPYNISSQIVVMLVDNRHVLDRATLMFQKEVAERLVAMPGGRQYGVLSVQAGYCFEIRKVMDVSPGQFRPRPKVMSTVLSFIPKTPVLALHDFDLFRKIVRSAFLNRRKKMLNSMKKNMDIRENLLRHAMDETGIPLDARAETVDVDTFVRLTNFLKKEGINP